MATRGAYIARMRVWYLPLILVLSLIASSCNIFFAVTPELWLVESGLDEYEARPSFSWNVKGIDLVQGFRFALHGSEGSGEWFEISRDAHQYRFDEFLDSGEYIFELQSRSTAGIWSRTASVDFPVISVPPYEPNDPLFEEPDTYDPYFGDPVQWNLEEIAIPRLWGLIREYELIAMIERQDVVVAVVDTGYTEHPDLVELMDIGLGYDFIALDPNQTPDWYWAQDGDGIDSDARDEGDRAPGGNSWHGTGVASVISATTDNGEGIAGIALHDLSGDYHLTHMPVRVLGVDGGTTFDIGQGITYAAGLGSFLQDYTGVLPQKRAKIINLSLGAGLPGFPLFNDPAVDPILAAAAKAGVILVAAAGNERQFGATDVTYPANSPYVISVAASTIDDEIAAYSNPGTFDGQIPTVDVAAPGGGLPYSLPPDSGSGVLSWYEYIITASPDGDAIQELDPEDYAYTGTAGTSIAAPHVSGLLALLASIDPDAMTLEVARYVLKHSARKSNVQPWDADFGYGIIDSVDAFGVFELLRSGRVTIESRGIDYTRPTRSMNEPGIEPAGPVAGSTLIIEFVTSEAARVVDAAGIAGGVRIRRGVSGKRRLITMPGAGTNSLADGRDRLLERADIGSIYYNYRYRALSTPTRNR